MQIETLFFGVVKDVVGKSKTSFDLKEGITIYEFQEFLLKKYPALTDIRNFAFAANEEYVKQDYRIRANDVIAIIPPVSGG